MVTYKKKIIDMIENINDLDVLIYLFHFIKGKIKINDNISK